MYTPINEAVDDAQSGSVRINGKKVLVNIVPTESVMALRVQLPDPPVKPVQVSANKLERDASHPINVEARAQVYTLREAAAAGIATGFIVEGRVLKPDDGPEFALLYAKTVSKKLGAGQIDDIAAEVSKIDSGAYVPPAEEDDGDEGKPVAVSGDGSADHSPQPNAAGQQDAGASLGSD